MLMEKGVSGMKTMIMIKISYLTAVYNVLRVRVF